MAAIEEAIGPVTGPGIARATALVIGPGIGPATEPAIAAETAAAGRDSAAVARRQARATSIKAVVVASTAAIATVHFREPAMRRARARLQTAGAPVRRLVRAVAVAACHEAAVGAAAAAVVVVAAADVDKGTRR